MVTRHMHEVEAAIIQWDGETAHEVEAVHSDANNLEELEPTKN